MTEHARRVLTDLLKKEKFARENRLLFANLNRPQAKFMNATTEARRDKLPRRLIFPGPNKIGKGQPVSEPVLTPSGWRPIGELKIGDWVFSGQGEQSIVTGVFNRGVREVYKFEFTDGSWTRADIDHRWVVRTPDSRWGNRRWSVKTTKDLIGTPKSAERRFSIPVAKPLETPYDSSLSPDPYTLGLWLGDGHSQNDRSRRGWKRRYAYITTADPEILDQIGYPISEAGQKYVYRIGMPMAEQLDSLGLLGLKSYEKFIPARYLNAGYHQRLDLLQGLMDTDGSVFGKYGSVLEYSSSSLKLAYGVWYLVHSLGGTARIRSRDTASGRKSYRVRIAMSSCPFRLKRKKDRFKVKKRTYDRILRSVKPDGYEECVCIQVANGSGTYLTRGFIVTHNTSVGVLRGCCLALGEHPFLPDDHPLRRLHNWRTPNVGLVVGEQLTQSVDKKLVPEYLFWLPKICKIDTKKNQQGVIVRIAINKDIYGKDLGSVVHYRSMDSDVESFEGIDMNWIHWDEPPPYKHFVAAERGLLPTDGISFMTFTSLKEPWIKDFADQSVDYGGSDAGIRVVEAGDIWQNWDGNGGFLTKEAIEEFIKIVPAEEYPARILGQWMQSGSVVYSSFRDDEPWVIPAFGVPRHWTKYEAVDPHDAKPTRWLFASASPYDIDVDGELVSRLFVIDHLNLSAQMTITEMVTEVKKKRIALGYIDKDPYCVLLDSRYGIQRRTPLNMEEPVNWKEKLEDAGAGYIELADTKHGSVEAGHKLVKAYLRQQFFKLEEREMPGVVFFDRCRGMDGPIESMRKYRYKTGSDKPEEDFKDWADCVRYLCSYRPRYVERQGRTADYQVRDEYAGR